MKISKKIYMLALGGYLCSVPYAGATSSISLDNLDVPYPFVKVVFVQTDGTKTTINAPEKGQRGQIAHVPQGTYSKIFVEVYSKAENSPKKGDCFPNPRLSGETVLTLTDKVNDANPLPLSISWVNGEFGFHSAKLGCDIAVLPQ